MRFFRSRRGIAAIAALLLVLFLFRPGVYKLRNRIATSIGNALGRKVALDNVRLRLLPRPGFDLEGLVIFDDVAFSAEPMIRAQDVSAAIRLRSLLRGRLEIANLSATEPSINLVRNNEGHWNLASLLERNAQIPAAPTAKPYSERRPAFPYLEATNARINFKLGQTKKSYALVNADVALWQDSENSWGARIKAEPVRTDFNLTDTGLLQIDARWQRSAKLRLTPLQITLQWRNGQLGQISKLFSGKDRGWRGGMDLTANLSGTPEALRIESSTALEGFHRYDIAGSENVRLAASCAGQYNAIDRTLANLLCESPVSGGALRLRGNFAEVEQQSVYDLTLEAEQIPMASLVRILRQAKRQIPRDLTATGVLNAEFHAVRRSTSFPPNTRRGSLQQAPIWSGTGAATNVRFSSTSTRSDAFLGTIPLALMAADPQDASQGRQQSVLPETRLRIGPAAISMNASAPMEATGLISATGYRFSLRGDAELRDLFRLEDVLGLGMAASAAEGSAKLDVSLSGPWQGFAAAVTAGSAQLRHVRAATRGLNIPIEIDSASVTLAPDTIMLEKLLASTGDTRWSGSVSAPRHCAPPGPISNIVSGTFPNCLFQFDLTADQLSSGDLVEWFAPQSDKRPWYRTLNSNSSSNSSPSSNDPPGLSTFLAIQAHGALHIGRFNWKNFSSSGVATQVDAARGKITLTAFRAQLLQGSTQGNWTIDLSSHDATSQRVRYHGSGNLQDISLTQLGTLMNEAWITGVADGKFDVEGSGGSFRELLARSDGHLKFVMRNGSLPHIEIPGSPSPLPVHRFSGDLHLKIGPAWDLSAGRLESQDSIYQVRGTASPASGVNFKLTRGGEQAWALTGTLAHPHIATVDRTEGERVEVNAKTVKP